MFFVCTFCNSFSINVRTSDAMVDHNTQRRTRKENISQEIVKVLDSLIFILLAIALRSIPKLFLSFCVSYLKRRMIQVKKEFNKTSTKIWQTIL